MSSTLIADRLRLRVAVEAERRRRQSGDLVDVPAELARCKADPAYFIDTYLVIDDAQGDSGGTMPFRLWPDQHTALDALASERLVIFLKARQLGISWLCLAYALWLVLFHPGKVVLLFSQGQVEASEMLRRLKAMYERLPGWMLSALPARDEDNASKQGWGNGSWCKCLPATSRAGRSFTASLVVMDEAAHQQYGGKLYAALKPTIDAGGQLFVVSSANGSDGFFDVLWEKAQAGLNAFRAIFLSWRSRPGRDEAWRARQFAESTDPELVKQEYPDDASEAFVASGRVRFPGSWIAAQAPNVRAAMAPGSDGFPAPLAHVPGLHVYAPRVLGRRYAIGADTAEGLEHGDADAATVVDRDTLEEVAHVHGRWEPEQYAEILADVADYYDAKVVVERNNHGHAVLLALKNLRPARVALGLDGRPGWVTNSATKPQAIDLLAGGLHDASIVVRSAATLHEMRFYLVMANGSTSAPAGKYDDRVMSWAVVLGWIRLGAAGIPRKARNPGG